MFGEAGLARDDPDYYAAYVVNHILGGGGFTSLLTEEVREKRGLAYSVYSYLYPLDHAPIWLGGLGTSNRSVEEALRLVRQEIERVARGEISQERLDDAKTYLTGSFPLRLTSNDQIAQTLVGMQVDDLGIDYLDRRNGYIEAVTLEDARRVARRLYHPDASAGGGGRRRERRLEGIRSDEVADGDPGPDNAAPAVWHGATFCR